MNASHQEVWRRRLEWWPAKQRGSVAGAGVLVGRIGAPGPHGVSGAEDLWWGAPPRGRWERGAGRGRARRGRSYGTVQPLVPASPSPPRRARGDPLRRVVEGTVQPVRWRSVDAACLRSDLPVRVSLPAQPPASVFFPFFSEFDY